MISNPRPVQGARPLNPNADEFEVKIGTHEQQQQISRDLSQQQQQQHHTHLDYSYPLILDGKDNRMFFFRFLQCIILFVCVCLCVCVKDFMWKHKIKLAAIKWKVYKIGNRWHNMYRSWNVLFQITSFLWHVPLRRPFCQSRVKLCWVLQSNLKR